MSQQGIGADGKHDFNGAKKGIWSKQDQLEAFHVDSDFDSELIYVTFAVIRQLCLFNFLRLFQTFLFLNFFRGSKLHLSPRPQ